jgi:hypothetical protein
MGHAHRLHSIAAQWNRRRTRSRRISPMIADRKAPGHGSNVPRAVQTQNGLAAARLHAVQSTQAAFPLSTEGRAEEQKIHS